MASYDLQAYSGAFKMIFAVLRSRGIGAGRHTIRRAAKHAVLVALVCTLAQPLAALSDTAASDAAVAEFIQAFRQIQAHYPDPVEHRTLIADAIRAMIRGLDPYSEYLDPAAYDELRQDTAGVFGGLGIEGGMEDNALRIVSVFEDSPAWRAGLRAGDRIVRLDQTDVGGLTLDEVIRMARGEAGTRIAVTLLRRDDKGPSIVSIERGVIQPRSVRFALLEHGYGHLRIDAFNHRTASGVVAMLEATLRSDSPLKGLVLDLRDNPGGALTAAIAVSSLFLPDGALVVYTQSASAPSRMHKFSDARRHLSAGDDHSEALRLLRAVPIAVLVNEGSASAAEIVAGALQDHKRAHVVGTRTFGKGSIQIIVPLLDGAAVKLTTAYYHAPGGRQIEGQGIMPDLVVAQSAGNDAADLDAARPAALQTHTSDAASGDRQLDRALRFLQDDAIVARH
jgi:carboxyl-terminal processing protease